MQTEKSTSLPDEKHVAEQMLKRIFVVAKIINQSDFYQKTCVKNLQNMGERTQKQ